MEPRTLTRYPKIKIFSDGMILGSQGQPLKPRINGDGYARVHCWDQERGWRQELVSRLVCEAFHGPAPTPQHQAAHGNGDPLDNRADNLRWATGKENCADRVIHGTDRKGSDHPRAKLNDEQVKEIMTLLDQGIPGTRIAQEYGVQKAQISSIKNRRSWSHIPWPDKGEIKITMTKTTTSKELLTEMITMVITPSMRAHLDHACAVRGDVPYAYLIREALRPWLETNAPLSPEELKRITDQWINEHQKG